MRGIRLVWSGQFWRGGFLVMFGVLASIVPCGGEPIINLSVSYGGGSPTDGFVLTWESSVGERYYLLRTRALASAGWQAVNGVPLMSSSNRVTFVDANDQSARFYRVLKLETGLEPMTNMVWIGAGTFTMGSPASEAEREPDEGPQTEVTFRQAFWMGRFEVTQRDYQALMGAHVNWSPGELNPVDRVSWDDAVAYCAALTAREQQAQRLPEAYRYRLPTEAEWEYACRAGTTTALHYGTELRSGMANFYGQMEYDSSIGTVFNPAGTDDFSSFAVGSYEPNAWGLYDMHGNVREWCLDGKFAYPGGSVVDPAGGASGDRVNRGGSWFSEGRYCRSADRYAHRQQERVDFIGFRIVLARTP